MTRQGVKVLTNRSFVWSETSQFLVLFEQISQSLPEEPESHEKDILSIVQFKKLVDNEFIQKISRHDGSLEKISSAIVSFSTSFEMFCEKSIFAVGKDSEANRGID